jgi:O-antigen/teichoic acid export membrane protein
MIENASSQTEIASGQQRVTRNAGIYLLSQLISWAATFISLSVIPRRLGEQTMGQIVLASSTLSAIMAFLTIGIESHLIREIGRDRQQAEKLLPATFGLRIFAVPLLALITYLMLRGIHASPAVQYYAIFALMGSSLQLFSEPMRSALAGWEQARYVSKTDILYSVCTLLAIPFLGYGGTALALSSLSATALALIMRTRWVGMQMRLRPAFDVRTWGQLICGGLPFVLNGAIITAMSYLLVLVLRHYMDEGAVGQFALAGRLMGAFMFVPTVLSAALLPSLSRLAQADAAEFRRMQLRVLSVLIVCGLPVTVGILILAGPLCHLLYGVHRYLLLPVALQYTALNILPLYIVTTIYQFLIAQNRNSVWSMILISTLVINVGLSWFLVPIMMHAIHNGIAGAFAANAIAEWISVIGAFILLRNNPLTSEMLGRTGRGMAASVLMAGAIWLTRGFFVLIPAALGSATFIVAAYVLHALPPQEQALIIDTLKRKLGRRGS